MMKSFILILGLFVVSIGLPAIAQEDEEAPLQPNKALHIEDGYAYATTSVQKNGAAFVTITNVREEPARIIGASSDVAESVQLHTHIMDGDVMMMRQVEGYDIPAGQTVTLKPTGHHIMLMGLKHSLTAGESFPLTLMSEHNGELTVDITIKSPGAAP